MTAGNQPYVPIDYFIELRCAAVLRLPGLKGSEQPLTALGETPIVI